MHFAYIAPPCLRVVARLPEMVKPMTLPHQLVYRPEFSHFQDPGAGRDPGFRTPGEGQEIPDPGGQAPAPDMPCGSNMLLPMVLVFAVIYFLMIRPQQKQEKARRAMLSEIRKGDKVVTNGGIHGTISNIGEDTVTLRVDNIKMTVDRSAIGRVIRGDGAAGDKLPK